MGETNLDSNNRSVDWFNGISTTATSLSINFLIIHKKCID